MVDIRSKAPVWMGGIMAVVGSLHFVAPKQFEAQVPPFLPRKRDLVYASGIVEVACGVGLLARKPIAGKLAALTLLAIWPANIQMALASGKGTLPARIDNKMALWARVPLQLPMLWAAMQGDGRNT